MLTAEATIPGCCGAGDVLESPSRVEALGMIWRPYLSRPLDTGEYISGR
jgi:hypothetical protein